MASQDRGSIVKKFNHSNYKYIINGKEHTRSQAIDIILNVLKMQNLTLKQISKKTKITDRNTLTLMKYMRENNIIESTNFRRGYESVYRIKGNCLLANILYPSVEEVEKAMKVKSRKVYRWK